MRESSDPPSRGSAVDRATNRALGHLMSNLGGTLRFDSFCAEVAAATRARTVILYSLADGMREMATAGCFPYSSEETGASLPSRLTATVIEAVRGGDATAIFPGAGSNGSVDTLEIDGQLLGLLLAVPADSFSDEDRQIRRRLADLAALALERGRSVVRLRRANGIKTEFVRTVSHELRTPLNTVIGYADLLVEEVFGELDDEQKKILRRVGDRARGLLEVIAATLDLPGVNSGRVALETRAVSMVDLLHELEADAREWRLRHDLQYQWKIPQELPEIATDAGKVRVILKNLIANAVKFTDKGRISVSARGLDGGVEVSVEDTGIGIEADAVQYVFDAFRQARPSIPGQYGGVGLGLYIVRRLVGMLSGRLRVESEIGVGTKFHVWLPCDPPGRKD